MKEDPNQEQSAASNDLSRRDFLRGAGTGIMASTLAPAGFVIAATGESVPMLGPDEAAITLSVNGTKHNLSVEPRVTLLNALRNHLNLTGAKLICDRGECGGCTVLMD